jgi:hypothetical protein
MTTINAFTFIYNNTKLQQRCIAFSYYGSGVLKKLFKENKMKCIVQVKRYIINDDPNDGFSPYHYYIEVKTPTGDKYIIDNCDSYNYWFYMDRFKPRGSIEKVRCRDINKAVKNEKCDIEDVVETTITYHFENICKYYKCQITNYPHLALNSSNSH